MLKYAIMIVLTVSYMLLFIFFTGGTIISCFNFKVQVFIIKFKMFTTWTTNVKIYSRIGKEKKKFGVSPKPYTKKVKNIYSISH